MPWEGSEGLEAKGMVRRACPGRKKKQRKPMAVGFPNASPHRHLSTSDPLGILACS